MGSVQEYLTVVDSAKFLNKTTRTVENYISAGILRVRKIRGHGKKWWIRKADLRALKEAGQKKLNLSDLWDLLHGVKVKLQSMEDRLDFLMRVADLNVSGLRDSSTAELIELYDEAADYLDIDLTQVPLDKMRDWADVFLQLSEIELERMVGPTQDHEPWHPFHELCLGLMSALRRRKGFSGNPEQQQAYRVLEKARKSLSRAALILSENHAARVGPVRMRHIASFGESEDSLDRYIASEIQHPSGANRIKKLG